MSRIRIANPQPGSARYTSASQAARYVQRGEAVQIGHELHFRSSSEQRHQRNIERQIGQERRCSDVYVDRRGAILWNGGDIDGQHRPGEVVS